MNNLAGKLSKMPESTSSLLLILYEKLYSSSDSSVTNASDTSENNKETICDRACED